MDELFEVRCPNNRWKGKTNNFNCNNMCGKVTASCGGEFWCRRCKILFNFVVNDIGEIGYFNYEESEVTRPPKNETEAIEDRLMELLN